MCLIFFVGHIYQSVIVGRKKDHSRLHSIYICRFKLSTCGWYKQEPIGWLIFWAHVVGKKSFYFSISFNIVHVQDNFKRFSLKKLRNNINSHNWILHVFFRYLSNFLKNLTIFRIKQLESFFSHTGETRIWFCDICNNCITKFFRLDRLNSHLQFTVLFV